MVDRKPIPEAEISEIEDAVPAWEVHVAMLVRGETYAEAQAVALHTLDGMGDVDTGEAGHIAGGRLL